MCGIIGMIAKQPGGFNMIHQAMFVDMLIVDQLRGEDSTGVYGCRFKGPPDVVKAAMDSTEFVGTNAYGRFNTEMYQNYKMVVGHNRKATKGNIVGANAHPFVEGKITLVHNGTIHNQAELNSDVEVDSHAITHALNDNDAAKALESINGAFALVWYDSENRTLNLARNKERPLVLAQTDDAWIFGSEPGMIHWITERHGEKIVSGRSVPVNKIITFNMEDREKYVEADYKDWVYVAPPAPPKQTHFPSAVSKPTSSSPNGGVTRDAVVHALTGEKKKVDLHSVVIAKKYQMGDTMLIKWKDFKEHSPGGELGIKLIGHPVYEEDGVIDENVFVTIWIPKMEDKEFDHYFNGYFTGTVTSYSVVGGLGTFFVKNVKTMSLGTTYNGTTLTESGWKKSLEWGCKDCQNPVFGKFEDIGKVFMKQRKDKSWRNICLRCSGNTPEQIADKEAAVELLAMAAVEVKSKNAEGHTIQ